MAAATETSSPYLLSYRRENAEEDRRLNSQHDVIKHAILDGNLVHPSIPIAEIQGAIADVACGTGVWLEDVRETLFSSANNSQNPPLLVGFDLNAHAFDASIAQAVKLVQHDCTTTFPAEYIGKFDLVNMRGLAYAIPRESFSRLISNATQLLRPGGYVQWLETDTRLFRQYPVTTDFTEAIDAVNAMRKSRGLVEDLPRFMLQECLHLDPKLDVLHFNLLPGGICKDLSLKGDSLIRRFSDIVLESVKLLLGAPLKEDSQVEQAETTNSESREKSAGMDHLENIHRLMAAIDAIRESDEITAGGIFPQLIAQKTLN